MWLYLIAIVFLIFGIVGGIATGGIFTIIFIPLGVIVLLAAIFSGGMAKLSQRRHGGRPPSQPLPHQPPHESGSVPTSPEALADARRAEQ
jgi:hypothetical protein